MYTTTTTHTFDHLYSITLCITVNVQYIPRYMVWIMMARGHIQARNQGATLPRNEL